MLGASARALKNTYAEGKHQLWNRRKASVKAGRTSSGGGLGQRREKRQPPAPKPWTTSLRSKRPMTACMATDMAMRALDNPHRIALRAAAFLKALGQPQATHRATPPPPSDLRPAHPAGEASLSLSLSLSLARARALALSTLSLLRALSLSLSLSRSRAVFRSLSLSRARSLSCSLSRSLALKRTLLWPTACFRSFSACVLICP
jgi:hypothetical protein